MTTSTWQDIKNHPYLAALDIFIPLTIWEARDRMSPEKIAAIRKSWARWHQQPSSFTTAQQLLVVHPDETHTPVVPPFEKAATQFSFSEAPDKFLFQ